MNARKQNLRAAIAPTHCLSKARILVCDDQKLIRARVREMLKDLSSLQVIGEAADGASAVRMALQLEPDVVLMDVSMPGMDGIEATRRILAACPRIRVLAFSADPDTTTMRQMSRAGACGYLVKTGDPVELVLALQRVLAGENYFSSRPRNSNTRPQVD